MKRAAILLIVAAFIYAPSLVAAAPLQRIGSAVQVVNQVSAELDQDSRSLTAGDEVHQDELIAVGPKSIGELEFEDETKLALGPGSQLLLDKFVYNGRRTESDIVVNLVKGAFRFITGLADKKSYHISTPSAAITVRGTIFDVYVADDDTVWVLLLEGGVTACNDRASCRQLSRVGHILLIAPDGEISGPMPWISLPGRDEIDFATAFPFMINAPSIQPDPPLTPEEVQEGDRDPIDPQSVIPASCPAGWDRFKELRSKPLGYSLKTFTSKGRKIICGEPRCQRGWKVYRKRGAIPSGWRKRSIGRPRSKYKFWCAKPRIEGCKPGRHEVKVDGICICKDGYDRSDAGQCVEIEPPTPPPPVCWNGWETIGAWEIMSYRRKGYTVKSRVDASQTVWCARPGRPLQCLGGWKNISASEVGIYKKKGYTVRRHGRGDSIIYCAKRPACGENEKRLHGNCVCINGYFRNSVGRCVTEEPGACPHGSKKFPIGKVPPGWRIIKSRLSKRGYVCAVPPDTPPPLQCWSGWSPIGKGEVRAYKRKGYDVKPQSKGLKTQWCARPGDHGCKPRSNEVKVNGRCVCKAGYSRRRGRDRCVPDKPDKLICEGGRITHSTSVGRSTCKCPHGNKLRKVGANHYVCKAGGNNCKKPRYRNQQNVCTCGPKKRWDGRRCIKVDRPRTCKAIGKIGKWPDCRNKPKKTCKQIGKVGKWPKCRNKPKKTCKQIGKVGKWPKCRNKPKKTCKQIGKVGKWPKCRNKPKKTCKQIGKIGKWPKCRNKPKNKAGQLKLPRKKKANKKKMSCKVLGMKGRWPNCRQRRKP